MKIKTSELIDAELDWAVAKCEGFKYELYEHNRKKWENGLHRPQHWQPSTNWAQGGPIIEREEIGTKRRAPCMKGEEWEAMGSITAKGAGYRYAIGPTPLIAAMRCYVASKLGDEIDIPKEFT